MGILDDVDQIAAGNLVPKRADLGTLRAYSLTLSVASATVPGVFHGGASHFAHALAPRAFVLWRFAHSGLSAYPKSTAARRLAKKAGAELLNQLEVAAKTVEGKVAREALGRDMAALRRSLDIVEGGAKAAELLAPDLTELSRLEMLAVSGKLSGTAGERLQDAFRRYHNAKLVSGAELDQAAADLSDSISHDLRAAKGTEGRFQPPSYYRKRIMSEVKRLKGAKPQGQITQLEHMLDDAVITKLPEQLRGTCTHVEAALSSSPGRWSRVAAILDRIQPVAAEDKNAREAAVSAVKGALGEMLAKITPAFREALDESKRQAHLLANALNRPAMRAGEDLPWKVVIPEFDVFAPKVAGKGTGLFVDQSVLVVNETTKQAYILFAAQVKAGDASTAKAIEQMIKDQQRLLKGQIELADAAGKRVMYALKEPADIGVLNRVFVGSSKGVEALQRSGQTTALSGRIRFASGPVDGIDLEQFAEFMLRTTGKLR
jgi:hypothetical protein